MTLSRSQTSGQVGDLVSSENRLTTFTLASPTGPSMVKAVDGLFALIDANSVHHKDPKCSRPDLVKADPILIARKKRGQGACSRGKTQL